MVIKLGEYQTFADVMRRVGDVPPERIRVKPQPGSATVADVTRILDHEGKICELVDGILVEKTMGMAESMLTIYIARIMDDFVRPRNLGILLGADGTIQIRVKLVRIPDIAFIAWDRFPDRKLPKEAVPLVVPNLAVEVLSKSNTKREMAIKREEYFDAGVVLVWEVDPTTRTIDVYTSLTDKSTLTIEDILDGSPVLQGFGVPVKDLFAELDRQG